MTQKILPAIRLILLFLVILAFAAPTSAFAQNIITQAVELTKSALEDYDFVELDSADTKISQAVKLIESAGLKDPGVANIYISQGVISYGKFKDEDPETAKKLALESFTKAVNLNPSVVIHPDYRTSELDEILNDARNAYLASQPPVEIAPPVADSATEEIQTPPPEVKPVEIKHTAVGSADHCTTIPIRAIVPSHPDVAHVRLYYTDEVGKPYAVLDMTPSESNPEEYSATIPDSATHNAHVRYYIEAAAADNHTLNTFASDTQPISSMLMGECKVKEEENSSKYGEPVFQFAALFGTGFGYVHGDTLRCESNRRCNPLDSPTRYSGASAGMSTLPFHFRLDAAVNLPAHFQIGVYFRLQAVNYADEDALYNILFGLSLRYYILHEQPYRLYVGLGLGYGGANATVFLGAAHDNFKDIYVYDGPVHIAPQVGFLWSLHKNVGLAFTLDIPIYFPNRPSFHFDLSVGPYFQF